MHQIYSAYELTDQEIVCAQCSWTGNDNDTVKEDLFLTEAIEMYCPSCDHYLGFINKASEPELSVDL